MENPPTGLDLRTRLLRRDYLAGTVLTFPDAALAELAAAAFDFVWIDLEHGALDVRDLRDVAIGAAAAGRAVIARVPRVGSEALAPVLDSGVAGVVFPMIESAAEAREAVAGTRYPPAGSRGFGPRRAASYTRAASSWQEYDRDLLRLVQIESAAGVAAAPEIAAIEGLDAVVVGCSDLSFAVGTPLTLDSPPMLDAVRRVQEAAANAGIVSGVAASGDADLVAELMGETSTLLVYGTDVRLYAAAMDQAAALCATGMSIAAAGRAG